MVKSKEPKYHCMTRLSNYGKDAIDFVKSCLKKQPEERATIGDLLKHDWIRKFFSPE